ncbi:TonB-dependent receptor [Algoriphagus sediminis]|uniref:TonB-dependent receptor n=1 Tax=Algoriphagus sediminis TaxID=3057113 RepID=A0ABT7YAR0_9BACT|nr:TonB-dependent receptor [Algoriphagus sediminis]MDN3203607.1 TonB-dependent receptor [Algoriphagus sediminis]
MKKAIKIFILAGIVFFGVSKIQAQTETRGEVSDQEFIIRKDRVLTLPTQPRAYEKLPILPQPKGLEDFQYTINRYGLNIRPLSLETTAAQKVYRKDRRDLYPGYVKAGYGNFASPLFEARYMATEVDQFNFSAQLNHQSFGEGPLGGEESKESHSHAGFDGSYYTDLVEIFGGLHWNQDGYSFYGFDPEEFEAADFQTPDNVFNTISIHGGVRDIEKVGPLSYEAKVGFRNFEDSYEAKESDIMFGGNVKYRLNDDWTIKTGLNFSGTNVENLNYSASRNFFSIRPSVEFRYGDFDFEAGINIISENDSIQDKSSDFRIFPALKAHYQFAEEFGFFAEFSGDVNRQTYHSFVSENPFLGPIDRILNTVNNYHLEGGIQGQFNEVFNYMGSVNVDRFNQLYFFVNSANEMSQFDIIYDDKSTVISIQGEVGLKISDTYQLGSEINLFQYSLNEVSEAWHRPVWEVSINNQIRPIESLLIQANLNFMGGVKARGMMLEESNAINVITLPTIADLQLQADFAITERFSVFAQGNNIFNGSNARWLMYPVRGIQLVGGLSYKF